MFVQNNLILDFDGTLIDDSTRHHQTFQKTADIEIDKATYWQYRREGLSNQELFKKLNGKNEFDLDKFKKIIESKEYLKLDQLIINPDKLGELQRNNHIVLCTVRSDRSNLFWQLDLLGIKQYFDEIVTITHAELQKTENKYKSHYLEKYFAHEKPGMIVGDTEIDIQTGKILGITTVAVLTGIRNEQFLLRYRPDRIISDINQL